MGGFAGIQIGKEVPIVLQIEDGAVDQYPQAVIRDDEGNLLATLDLAHADNGAYTPASPYLMPNEDYIRVTYIIYSDAGHITESSMYFRDIDVFVQIYPNDYKADVSNLDVLVSSRSSHSDPTSAIKGTPGKTIQEVFDNERGTDGVPLNPVLVNDSRLDNLDAMVSSRSSHNDPTSGIIGAPGKTNQEVFDNERGTDGANTIVPPTTGEIRAELESVGSYLDFIREINNGRWKIDTTLNQMVFYKSDNVTEIARFDLKDENGDPAHENILERVKV